MTPRTVAYVPVLHYLLEFAQIHIHCSLLLLPSVFPSIRVLSSQLALYISWSKYWSLSLSLSPSNESSGLISFTIDWFDLLVLCLIAQSVRLFATPMDCSPPSSSVYGGFSRQEYWSGLPCPSPGDLPNPGLLNCRQILCHLSHQGSPRTLEWVAYPFSGGSS